MMGTLLLVLASAVWGFIHSLTASRSMKGAVERVCGSSFMNWYRLAYNLISVIMFMPLLVLVMSLPDRMLYEIPVPWVVLTFVLQLMAILALVVGVLQTDFWSFVGIRQAMGGESKNQIVTGGLYRYVRHPLYTAGLVFIWLTPVMTHNRLVLYLSLTIYIIIGAIFEERKLLREFGRDYEEYRARTPMLIPYPVNRR